MYRAAKVLVARASEVNLVKLAGLVAYRRGAGVALQWEVKKVSGTVSAAISRTVPF